MQKSQIKKIEIQYETRVEWDLRSLFFFKYLTKSIEFYLFSSLNSKLINKFKRNFSLKNLSFSF